MSDLETVGVLALMAHQEGKTLQEFSAELLTKIEAADAGRPAAPPPEEKK